MPITYSVIVNSIDAQKLNRLKCNLERCLRYTSWELIHIPDAKGMCEGYNRGIQLSSGEYLIFCHDDIEFIADDISKPLAYGFKNSDVFGVMGTRLLIGHNFELSGLPNTIGMHVISEQDGSFTLLYVGIEGPLMYGIQGIDGAVIGCNRNVAESLGWDEINFKGWHCYDVDFSYRAFRAGFNVAITGLLPIIHHTKSTFSDPDVLLAAKVLRQKHPLLETCAFDKSDVKWISNMKRGFESLDSVMTFLHENYSAIIMDNAKVRADTAGLKIKLFF